MTKQATRHGKHWGGTPCLKNKTIRPLKNKGSLLNFVMGITTPTKWMAPNTTIVIVTSITNHKDWSVRTFCSKNRGFGSVCPKHFCV